MQHYRVLFLQPNGSVLRAEELHVRDDLDALEKAQGICTEHDVEVWDGTRLAIRIDHETHEVGHRLLNL